MRSVARSAAALDVEHSGSLRRLRDAGWDDLAGPEDLYATTRWLDMFEGAGQGTAHYLLGWTDAGRLAAGLACYLFAASPTMRPPMARVDRVLGRALQPAPAGRNGASPPGRLLPNLCCGGRQAADTRLLVAPGSPPDTRRRAAADLLEAAERLAADHGAASISLNFVDAGDRELRAECAGRGYLELRSQQRCELPMGEGGLERYLRQFRSHRRVAIRRELRRLDEAGVVFRAGLLRDAPLAELAELERASLRRYGIRRRTAQVERALRDLLAAFGDDCLVVTGYLGRAACCFTAHVRWHDRLYGRHDGFDYGLQADLPLYFGLLFYAPVALAPELGVTAIDYGTGSIEAKASRGCRVIDQYLYVRCLDASVHRDLASLLARADAGRGPPAGLDGGREQRDGGPNAKGGCSANT